MKLHCLTLNWNGKELLQNMLPSLIKNLERLSCDWQIHVKDNGSSDDSINFMENFPVSIIKINHN